MWSAGAALSMKYPAWYLFEFLANHGMLTIGGTPRWKTVVGGSRTYVDRAVKKLKAVHVSTPIRAVSRTGHGVEIRDDGNVLHTADHVVIATHPDQALGLLADPTREEKEVLGAFLFNTLSEVREITDDWLERYNEIRPHDALGSLPPARYREQLLAAETPL